MRVLAVVCLLLVAFPSIAAAQSEQTTDRDAEIVYRILSAQTVGERRVMFRSVTPETKAALWRAHVRHFVGSHPELSDVQRKVIAQFMTLVSAELYRPHADDPEWEALFGLPFARMQQSATAVLSPELYREAFAVLGPLADPAPAARSLSAAAASRNVPSKAQPDYCVGCWNAPDCECNMGDNWCGWGQTCFGDNCKSDSWGCGTMWQHICNGMCH